MDAVGFTLATAFLAVAFTVFGILDRLLVGVATEIRYSLALPIVSGVRAWARATRDAGPEEASPGSPAGDGPSGPVDATEPVVPVTGVRAAPLR